MAKEKLNWKSRLKGESQKLFNRFKIYRDMSPEERSLENVQKILKKDNNGQKNKNNKEIPLSTLQSNSAKWSWVERAKLHDAEIELEELEKNRKDFDETNEKFKETFKKILDLANELLDEMYNGDYATSTKIQMLRTLVTLLDDTYKNFRLAHGRSTRISESTNQHHVDADVEVELAGEENIYAYTPEEMERIQNISNAAEDFLDKL